jgi:hypothetical protein
MIGTGSAHGGLRSFSIKIGLSLSLLFIVLVLLWDHFMFNVDRRL